MAVSINSNLSPVSLPGIRNSERSGSAVAEPQSPGDSYQTSTPTDSFLDFKPYRNGVSVAQTGAPVPAGFSPINAQDAKQVRDVVQSVRDHLPGDGHVEAVAEKRFLGDATAVNRYTRVGPLSEKNRLNVDGAKGRTWAAGDVVVERADHTLVRTPHQSRAR